MRHMKEAFSKKIISIIFFMMVTLLFGISVHAETVERQTADYTLYSSGKLVIHKNAAKFFDDNHYILIDVSFPTIGRELLTDCVAREPWSDGDSYYTNLKVNYIVIECPNEVYIPEILWYYPNVTRLELFHKNTKLYKDDNRLLLVKGINSSYNRDVWINACNQFANNWNEKVKAKVSIYCDRYKGYDYFYGRISTGQVTVINHYKDPNVITAAGRTVSASDKNQTFSIGATCLGGTLSYKSDNPNITVSNTGLVTIKKGYIGSANITISTKGDSAYKPATKQIRIKVNKLKTTISVAKTTFYISNGKKTYDLKVKTNSNVKLKYKSDNKNITVNSKGVITVKKRFLGSCKITISTEGNSYSTSAKKVITIKVIKKDNPIQAANITTNYSTGRKVFSLNASCPGKTKLTYKSNNTHIKVSGNGTVTISAGYVGSATITISTGGNSFYKSSEKKVTVTVRDRTGSSTNGSGSSSGGSRLRICNQCVGRGGIAGECYLCHGEGGHWYGPVSNRRWSYCLSCHGRGICQYCGGDGIKD